MDCFEIFYKRPKLLKARAQTYSNYKHHNTVKFVLGIAPQGSTYKRLLAYVYCAEMKLLPFYKRQKTVEDVHFVHQLSQVQIHVERVISFLRQKYTILEHILPINIILVVSLWFPLLLTVLRTAAVNIIREAKGNLCY